MGRKINITLTYCLIVSLTLHLSLVGLSYVDLNIKQQFTGLTEALSDLVDKIKNAETLSDKIEAVTDEVSESVSTAVDSLKKGKKLRFGPKQESWAKHDLAQAQAEAEAKKKAEQQLLQGGGGDFLPPPNPISVSLIHKPQEETQSLEGNPSPEPLVEANNPTQGLRYIQSIAASCDEKTAKTYGGIGLEFQSLPNKSRIVINKVPVGYPAYKAGIQVGDEVEGDVMRFRGPEGSQVNVEVYRNNQKLSFLVTRVKICYQEKTMDLNNPLILKQ